jgi:hypothetical protein
MVKKKSPLASWRTMVVGTWCFLVAFFLWFKMVNNVLVFRILNYYLSMRFLSVVSPLIFLMGKNRTIFKFYSFFLKIFL